MIHYTAMPLDLVYEGYAEFNPTYEEMNYEGIQMVVERVGHNQAKIVRLLSCDPQVYLNARYEPGRMIHFQPQMLDS